MWLSATPGSSPRPLQSVARIPLLLLGGELGPHFCALSGVYSGGGEKRTVSVAPVGSPHCTHPGGRREMLGLGQQPRKSPGSPS